MSSKAAPSETAKCGGAVSPRNLILCSDGTGNRGGKARGTNVWRIYEALDRRPHQETQQLAIYDDGVGTSSVKPVALLAGAFGWGLARNVRQLYGWLARNYRPHDRIFLFGFSRGAFTVRCVAGMISRFGVLNGRDLSNHEINRWVLHTWMAYKESQHVFRFPWRQRLVHRHRSKFVDGVRVRFIGAWDTVQAYGLPLDGPKELLAWAMRPLVWIPFLGRFTMTRFRTRRLPCRVDRACHALAIDDERRTFHPVLWDETGCGDCVEQVWFAGVHSDVGGGYAKGSLSYVSLAWMMDEARAAGLRFADNAQEAVERAMDPLGPMHDSRSGPAAYYRFSPRNVAKLSLRHGVRQLRVHDTVLERAYLTPASGVPTVLPPDFGVVGGPSGADHQQLRPDKEKVADLWKVHAQRRLLYFALLGWTAALVIVPWRLEWGWPPATQAVGSIAGFGTALGFLIWLRHRLRDRVNDLGRLAWLPATPAGSADAALVRGSTGRLPVGTDIQDESGDDGEPEPSAA